MPTLETLATEEQHVWAEYLDVTQRAHTGQSMSYDEVEPWAWRKLNLKLLWIQRQRDECK